MGASGQKFAQSLANSGNGIRPRDADDIEPLRASGGCESGFEIVWRQKSRSA
jgi:hypothetical protein